MMSVPRPAMFVAMVTAPTTGLSHDLRFTLYVLRLGIEQVVGNLLLSQQGTQQLALFD